MSLRSLYSQRPEWMYAYCHRCEGRCEYATWRGHLKYHILDLQIELRKYEHRRARKACIKKGTHQVKRRGGCPSCKL